MPSIYVESLLLRFDPLQNSLIEMTPLSIEFLDTGFHFFVKNTKKHQKNA